MEEKIKEAIREYYSGRDWQESLEGRVEVTFDNITGNNKIQELKKLPPTLRNKVLEIQIKQYSKNNEFIDPLSESS